MKFREHLSFVEDIDLISFGLTMNLVTGLISPPVGFNIYVGSSLCKLPLYDVMKSTLPILFIMLCALILITYVPWISLVTPEWFSVEVQMLQHLQNLSLTGICLRNFIFCLESEEANIGGIDERYFGIF